ncbi:Asp23/Gls24 family envelope stress response protein [Kurthia huakuii]|uniref:Asp23/Gls24 family envelope stress response protein n=1 Tax=Kurthia huakuii TaxID=1421019 RepID=UPI000496592F|nr:Asp23/Gls24 family envelope stress response protein [Kurthia huakuii]MBM7698371.1 putative alkaline shock family protein YloU [Kurthia huakuii]
MSVELTNEFGHIDIANDVVAQIAGGAAIECYGIVGMASKHQVRDGLTDILRKENFARGVLVRQDSEGENKNLHIDMYVIVSYGTKISEVAYQVQSKVKYTLDTTLGMAVNSVNVYVQGVRVAND